MKRSRLAGGTAFLAGTILLAGCRTKPLLLPSGEVRQISGFATLRLSRSGETVRTKFAFNVVLPDQARLEVFDALGRSASMFLVRGGEAYLVLPSEKAYWRGGRDEVIEKFMGFPVRPDEIAGLITGHWTDKAAAGWSLERDVRGRTISGIRGDLSFRVLEFMPGGDFPRRWTFRHPSGSGSIGLLDLTFNKPGSEPSWAFLRTFSPKTWAEIERLLK